MIAWCWRSEALHCGAALWDLAQEWHLGVMWCTVEVNGGNKLKLFQFSRVDGLNFTLGAWTHFFSKRLENSIDTFKVAIKAAVWLNFHTLFCWDGVIAKSVSAFHMPDFISCFLNSYTMQEFPFFSEEEGWFLTQNHQDCLKYTTVVAATASDVPWSTERSARWSRWMKKCCQ